MDLPPIKEDIPNWLNLWDGSMELPVIKEVIPDWLIYYRYTMREEARKHGYSY